MRRWPSYTELYRRPALFARRRRRRLGMVRVAECSSSPPSLSSLAGRVFLAAS